MRGKKVTGSMNQLAQGDIVLFRHGKRQGHVDPAIVAEFDEFSADLYVFCIAGEMKFVDDAVLGEDGVFTY